MTARRADANQSEIVAALRALGCYVFDTHEVGRGFPDLFVAHGERSWLVEVKSSPHGELTRDELVFMLNCPVETHRIIHSVDEAVRMVTGI